MNYYRTVNGEILLSAELNESIDLTNAKSSNNIIDLLEAGDLIKIEYCPVASLKRITSLFLVSSIMWEGALINLDNTCMNLQILDGEFTCKKGIYENVKPVILSVITHEKLESIEFNLDNKPEKGLSR